MTDAVPAAEPRARGWGLLIAALVAFLLLPPAFAIILPVTRGLLLMLPALGALMVVGWLAGGSLMLAVAWVAVAIVAVAVPPSAGVFDTMQRAWSVLLAGGFGLILALDRRDRRPPARLGCSCAISSTKARFATMQCLPRVSRL